MKISARKLNSLIRQGADIAGWDVFMTYTDPRVNGKRVKFMRDGWDPGETVKANVLKSTKDILAKYGLNKDTQVSWRLGWTWRGVYPYLAVHFKLAK